MDKKTPMDISYAVIAAMAVLVVGPPRTGKTLLAEGLPSLEPQDPDARRESR